MPEDSNASSVSLCPLLHEPLCKLQVRWESRGNIYTFKFKLKSLSERKEKAKLGFPDPSKKPKIHETSSRISNTLLYTRIRVAASDSTACQVLYLKKKVKISNQFN